MNEATAVPTSPQDASRAISTSLVDQDEDFHLETRGLTKQFSGFFAVRDVNLRVRKGTIHALIGPNGAGKTTCFNLLTKFLQPTEGHILFKGKDITATAPADVARLGLVRSFQISAVFPHRRCCIAPGTETQSPVSAASTKETVKTTRAGKAGCLRRTCGDDARVLFQFRTRGCGCVAHPAFPAPSIFGGQSF